MKRKEAIIAISLATAMTATATGCGTDVSAYENQISELTAQVTDLKSELIDVQNKSDDITKKNDELNAQITALDEELSSIESVLETETKVQDSLLSTLSNMQIDVTKYASDSTKIYANPSETEENEVLELSLNDECFAGMVFSDAENAEQWTALASLVTTDASGKENYQIISNVTYKGEKSNDAKVWFLSRQIDTITVADKTIKADDLAENQEIRIVYARTSLLSNSKVTEQQHTSAEKGSTPKQSTPQQSAPESVPGGWDDLPDVGTPGGGCPSMTGMNIQFH